MRIRHSTGSGPDKVELQMTAMIDIVFQLLAFFIMTLKIVALEGDFSVKMPTPAPAQGSTTEEQLPTTLQLRLRADETGELLQIQLDQFPPFNSFAELNSVLINLLGNDTGPGSMRDSTEIELDVDYNLRYEFTIQAISNISGYRTPDGQIVKLIDKIRFAPPRQ